MLRTLSRVGLVVASLAAAFGPLAGGGGTASATEYDQCAPRGADLFYNFYATGGDCYGQLPASTAGMYPAPYPAPALGGHVYYTYQPFLPHEHMYAHHRVYHRHYNGGMGLARTKAVWYYNPVKAAWQGVKQAVRLPR